MVFEDVIGWCTLIKDSFSTMHEAKRPQQEKSRVCVCVYVGGFVFYWFTDSKGNGWQKCKLEMGMVQKHGIVQEFDTSPLPACIF